MKMRHSLVVPALLAGALAAGGCNATADFESLNKSFSVAKDAASKAKNSNVVGAAIATNLAAVELLGALSNNANGVIAAGGANVIAPGGANYSLLATTEEGSEELKSDVLDQHGKPVVTGSYKYKRTVGDDGSLRYELKEFKGDASGYKFNVAGSYAFVPDADAKDAVKAGKAIPAQVKADLKGTIDGGESTALELTFDVRNPLPDNAEKFAALKMGGTGGVACAVSMRSGNFVLEIRDGAGTLLQSVTATKNGTITSTGASK